MITYKLVNILICLFCTLMIPVYAMNLIKNTDFTYGQIFFLTLSFGIVLVTLLILVVCGWALISSCI